MPDSVTERIPGVLAVQNRAEIEVERAARPVPLKTAEHILREMRKVYNRVHAGTIPSHEGTRRIFILAALLRAHETVVIEQRLDAVEAAVASRDTTP